MRIHTQITGFSQLLIFLIVILTIPFPAKSAIIDVGPGQSISTAMVNAVAGDTISLMGKEYYENVVIEKLVYLKGENKPVIRGLYEGNVLHIKASGTTVDGIHISESGANLTKDMTCILIEADSVTINNCLITQPLHGIYVKAGNWTTLTNNRIEGRLDLIESDRGNGIHLWNTRFNNIENNEILNVRDGIYFSFADSTEIRNNYIHNVRYGLHYMYSNNNIFHDNRFTENVAGAALMYSHNIEFKRNVFARCRGFRAYGILFQSMDSTYAENNLVLDNSRGIFLNNADYCIINNNDIVDNDLALQLNGGCDNNFIYQNNFINNLSDLILDVSDINTTWTNESGGNFWSTYQGYDLTDDKIGDIPHSIQHVFQIMETKVPEVRFYLFSPAAVILEIAERALPILNLGKAKDKLPYIYQYDNSEVPWILDGEDTYRSSPISAGLYLIGVLCPIFVLFRWSRGSGRSN